MYKMNVKLDKMAHEHLTVRSDNRIN